MGTFSDLNSGGGGGSYRQLNGPAPAPKPAPQSAAAGGDARKSADYAKLMASAKQTNDATNATLGKMGWLGQRAAQAYDQAQGAISSLPFAGDLLGLGAKGIAMANNAVAGATGGQTINSDAAYAAAKDSFGKQRAQAYARHPLTTGATSLAGMIAAPAAAGTKAAGLLAKVGEAAPAVADAAAAVGNVANKVAPAGSLARSALSGGLLGGLYGAGEGEGADRLRNAGAGALYGGLLGGGLHLAAPFVGALAGAGQDAARGVGKFFSKPFGAEVADLGPTPADLEQARAAAANLAARTGLKTPEAFAARAAEKFGDKPASAAEVIGRTGVTQLGAVGRRAGDTAQNLEDLLRARAGGASERIAGDFTKDLGVSPEASAGNIDSIVEQGQKAAGDLYTKALAGEGGITNTALEEIQQRPIVQEAMKAVQRSAANRGKLAQGLTMGRVEVPEAAQGVSPQAAPDIGRTPIAPTAEPPVLPAAPEVKVPRGPAEQPSQGPSLLTFLRNRGLGIDSAEPEAGDIAGRGMRISLREGGGKLDDHALAAADAGYFPELNGQRPTIPQLLDAMDQEARGAKRYAASAEPGAQGRFDARMAAEAQNRALESEQAGRQADSDAAFRQQQSADQMSQADWDKFMGEVGPNPDDWRSLATGTEAPQGGGTGVNAPRYEPALQEAPTAASWDAVKKKLGQLVERDPAGRAVTSGAVGDKNADLIAADRALTGALAGDEQGAGGALPPEYRQALDVSGDYLGQRAAFDRLSGKLTQSDTRTFGKLWKSLKTPAEQDAGRAALAHDVRRMADAGLLRGGKFSTPGIQGKLELAFGGKGNTAAFLRKMDQEASLARTGGQMMPGNGSGTAGWQNALQGDTETPLSEAAIEAAGHTATGNAIGGVKTLAKAYAQKVGAYGKTAGMPVHVLNEYGRLLALSPEEFATFLQGRDPQTFRVIGDLPGRLGAALSTHFTQAADQ